MDGNENAHSTLIALSPEDLHDLLEKAAEVGANAGIDKYVEELKKSQKKRGDRRLHNTKLLLRNFRMLQENAENSVFGRTQMEESAADILESMMNIYIEVCCEKSSNELDKRRYDIIYGLYISEDKISRKELAEKWNVSNDTTYIDEKIALERLSALIFGVDGLTLQ